MKKKTPKSDPLERLFSAKKEKTAFATNAQKNALFPRLEKAAKKRLKDDEHEKTEEAYLRGSDRAYLNIIAECRRQLGSIGKSALEDWSIERAEVVLKLREICSRFHASEWPDDLHLVDVIEKYLMPAIEEQMDNLE